MTKKIKILFAVNDLRVGGAQSMVVEQASAIDPGRFDPYLLTILRDKGPSLAEKLALPAEKHVRLFFRSLFDVPSWLRLYRILRKEKFDAVITNLFQTNTIVRPAAIAARVPVIISYEHNIYRNKRPWQIITDRILARFTYRIVAGAPQVKAFTVAQEHLPEEKVQVIYDAALLSFEDVKRRRNDVLARMGLPLDRLYIVACGRLVEQKGHTHLIEALRQVREHYGRAPHKIKLLIFGDGELRGALAEQIKRDKLGDEVLLAGTAPIEDILAISDIFSLISMWEGFSIALVQAMNAGCAIVASSVSGSVDAIENGVSGILVPPGDARAAAAALIRLIDAGDLRRALGDGARKRSRRFDIQNQIKEIEALVAGAPRLQS